MSEGKGGLIKGIITLAIGGTVYSVSQADVAKNFSKDTGMSQEQAQQYVESVKEEDLVPYDELGADYVTEGQETIGMAAQIDCVNYTYEWESAALTCQTGKSQLKNIGDAEVALGRAYTRLASDTATTEDITLVIGLIDKLNTSYNSAIAMLLFDPVARDEMKKANSYNKATLQAALDSK